MNNHRNLELMGEFLLKLGYAPVMVACLEDFDSALDSRTEISLALVDLTGFDRTIWDTCSRLHEQNIPLLIISPKYNLAFERESISRGASGILVKPLIMRELTSLIQQMVSHRET